MYATGFVPDSWKQATVIPLLKPGKERQKPESYRAISLLSCLSKIFERLVNARLTWHLETKNLLPNYQSGFRKGRSTMDNLVDLEQRIKMNMNNKKKTYAVFLDMSRAYDKVWIPGLLKKIAKLGIDGRLLDWLKQFLLGRSFRVRIGDLLSDARQLLTGVPQGAILSPLLFNIMLFDFPTAPHLVKTLLYADDVEADVTASSNAEAEEILNPYLDAISHWAREWRFDFSIEKSAVVVFTRDAARHPPQLYIMGNRIQSLESVKFLGLTFDRKLQWKEHVNNVVVKCMRANNALAMVARRKYGPTIPALVSLHIALVRSQVDYGLVVYGEACNTRMEKIDVTLRSSLRIILGAVKSSPKTGLYAELGLEPVSFRRKWLAARYVIRCSRRPNNVAYASTRKVASQSVDWPRLKAPALAEILNELIDVSYRFLCTEPDVQPQFRSPPPWAPPSVATLWFPMSKTKALANKQEACQRVQALVNSLQLSSIVTFTDGAHHQDTDRTACAVYCPELEIEKAWRLRPGSSIFTAEVLAVKKALDLVHEKVTVKSNVLVCIDSQAAIRALSSPSTEPEEAVSATLNSIHKLKSTGLSVTLAWIPSHVGIPGNERADSLASEACQDPSTTVLKQSLSTSEQFSVYKKNWKVDLRNHLNEKERMSVSFRDSPGRAPWQFVKDRQICIALHRLRSGHNRLNSSRPWLDVNRDPSCRFCQSANEDAEHIIIQCPNLEHYRLKLKEVCRKNSAQFVLKTVLGCNKEVSRSAQFKIRDSLCVFIRRANLANLV
jgi:ribonuclease HI